MVYRGLGSGIIRALKEDVHIDFINNESGNQFTTILYRNKVTTNLKNEKTNLETNLENEKTNLETKITSLKTTQERLLDLIQKNPTITRQQLADHIGLTIAGVKEPLAKMSANGLINHEGSTKKGYWIIISSKV